MRAVIDPNVLISALLSRNGTPAELIVQWLNGAFELVASPALFDELERVLTDPKLRARIPPEDAAAFVALLRAGADERDDPDGRPAVRSPDPGDDYLIALASTSEAVIVSGDGHLLGLADMIPVYSPVEFFQLLAQD